ncbi:EthD family reductase [Okibacterium endophyticum]
MHKLVVLYPHPQDPAAFEKYYREVHLPLARRLPGVLDMRFATNVHAAQGESPYFAIFEADFPDAAALGAAMSSPEGRAVEADVPNYASAGAIVVDYEAEAMPV